MFAGSKTARDILLLPLLPFGIIGIGVCLFLWSLKIKMQSGRRLLSPIKNFPCIGKLLRFNAVEVVPPEKLQEVGGSFEEVEAMLSQKQREQEELVDRSPRGDPDEGFPNSESGSFLFFCLLL